MKQVFTPKDLARLPAVCLDNLRALSNGRPNNLAAWKLAGLPADATHIEVKVGESITTEIVVGWD